MIFKDKYTFTLLSIYPKGIRPCTFMYNVLSVALLMKIIKFNKGT